MPLIEPELGDALHPAVKRKANRTGKLRATARRVVTYSTEVMVKITGFGKGAGHVKAHLEYISRNGKVELENDRGEIFSGKEEVKAFFQDWEKDFGDGRRRRNQRDTMHLVLSMPATTDPESVRCASREFARVTFGKNHEYVFALHTDEPHPHCHVTVKCLGFDGTRLNPRKADLQAWREGFADKLRDQGIVEAEATPRRARGVIKKAENSVIRHIERGDRSHPPRVSKVRASKVKEAAGELSGQPVPQRAWEEAIRARQYRVRRAWLNAADALEQTETRLTFNRKETCNERPDYEHISAERARAGQLRACVYQSRLEKSGRQTPTGAIASMRNLSGLDVVQHGRVAQVLLSPDALNRMGRRAAADPEMRRARDGDARAFGDGERLGGQRSVAEENQALASRIRAFVEAMPPLDTERHQIKRDLMRRFGQKVQKRDQERDQRKGKDMER
ncbi:MAG: relaxase/mobilization nuclease domain-containing protein [Azoarcus sp.]|jgi:type IV secretory pathway VirD2 relaxase|nr:relaxase/mobilization nuclease domain-containing protein [Azoarcus sp.]